MKKNIFLYLLILFIRTNFILNSKDEIKTKKHLPEKHQKIKKDNEKKEKSETFDKNENKETKPKSQRQKNLEDRQRKTELRRTNLIITNPVKAKKPEGYKKSKAPNRQQLNKYAIQANIKQLTSQELDNLEKNKKVVTIRDMANRAKKDPAVRTAMDLARKNKNWKKFIEQFNSLFFNFEDFHQFKFFDFDIFFDFFFFSPFYLFPYTFYSTFYKDFPELWPWWYPFYWHYEPYATQIRTLYIEKENYNKALEKIEEKLDDLIDQINEKKLTQDIKFEINKLAWMILDIKRTINSSRVTENQKDNLLFKIDKMIKKISAII